MNAAIHQLIPIAQLQPSPFNRKRFDKTKMEELTENVRVQGVIVPILVRPMGDAFEIVAGERRWRAAKGAELATVPAIVRTLTDAEALELQVIENNQREDVHPLEEAEGYERLMKCKKANGETYSADDIAAKVGKSRSYVFGRMKLCALCPEARKAFYEDQLDASRALLIARIGHHDTQRQALKDVTKGRYGNGDPMSYREAHQHILQNYTLALKSAPFDVKDEKLLAKVGACGPCPKRTGNQVDLFGDVKSADVCTDPKCFDDKRQAHFRVSVDDLEAQGFKVIAGDAAKKIVLHWEHSQGFNGYVNLSGGYEKFDGTTYAAGRSQKVSALFDKDYKPAKLQHPITGKFLEVVTTQAIAAAAAKKAKASNGKKNSTGGSKGGSRSARSREPEKSEVEQFREKLFAHVCAKLPESLGVEELRIVVEESLNGDPDQMLVQTLLLPTKTDAKASYGTSQALIQKAIPKLDVAGLSRLAIALLLSADCNEYSSSQGERLLAAAKRYGVDVAAVKASLKAAASTEESTPAKKKAKRK